MEGKSAPGKPRHEIRFLLAAAAVLALTIALAFWFAVPLWPADDGQPELLPMVQSARVDLNTADLEALCILPGIGEKKAQAILDYRAQHGSFARLEDVAQVSGITLEMIAGWADLAYVS